MLRFLGYGGKTTTKKYSFGIGQSSGKLSLEIGWVFNLKLKICIRSIVFMRIIPKTKLQEGMIN
jgi:hypothetical protein